MATGRNPALGVVINKADQMVRQKRYDKNFPAVNKRVAKAMEDNDPQAVIDSLTDFQRLFAAEYIKDFNATQAAIRAGTTSNHPNKIGNQMRNHPGVRVAIDALLADRAEKTDVKPDYVINKVVRTVEKAEQQGNHTAVLRGLELLARHLGMLTDKQEITGKDGGAIQYERHLQDAADLTSAISRLAEREGEGGEAQGSKS